MTLNCVPGKSDVYSIEYSEGNIVSKEEIHLSSDPSGMHWNLMDNDILGSGSFNFTSNGVMTIRTSKKGEIKFVKE